MHAFVNRGPKGFGLLVVTKVGERLGMIRVDREKQTRRKGQKPVPAVHPFDAEYGTDTSGLMWGELIESGQRNWLWSTAYYGISPSLLTRAIEALGIDYERFSFVDLGSGKGRALLVASRFPFQKIVGVEFVSDLSAVARTNIEGFNASWRMCRQIEAVTGDATEYEYPAGPLVVYLYNPFLPPVLKRCLKRLSAVSEREPREVYLMYANPAFAGLVKKHAPRFEVQWERMFRFTPEEAEADKFGTSEEKVMVWKFRA